MKDLWFGLVMLALGAGMFVWTQKDFAGLVRNTGRLSMWGGLLPSTRIGLTSVSLFAILAGVHVLTFDGTRSALDNIVAALLLFLLFGGLIHDFVYWLLARPSDRGSEP
ncbi:hypothetical protein GCM10027084_28900 [Pseudoxanthomonas sangjuensis]|uniref:hypothetical protein n=1 Tax=Pseudoxanthomonas sangjuensis TaxID=1503750 RepID=UPI001391E19C|nr:hypothetical protein [Pseudoxanthomonas sangjuensis]KAF1705896.1 hypothetical protein CSC71_14840 [Pseudoxanthomonas sangjuensis]